MPTKSEIFAAHDGDVDHILAAWPNIDPAGYALWADQALARCLRADVKAWERRQTIRIDADALTADAGQERLVDVPAKRRDVKVRAKIATDSGSVDLLSLSGPEGAAVLRAAAMRDLPGARTTVARRELDLRVADLMVSESARLGRDVTVAEVLELAERAA